MKALPCLGAVAVERKPQSPQGLSTGAWLSGGLGDRQPGTQPTGEGTARLHDDPQMRSGEGLYVPGGSVVGPLPCCAPCLGSGFGEQGQQSPTVTVMSDDGDMWL